MKPCRNPLKINLLKTLFFLLAGCSTLTGFAFAADKIQGKYEVIGSIEKLKGVKQVEMTEFFNYSCGHCYKFLETSKKLHAKFKDKLYHKKYPIFWGQQTALPAKAFYITDKLGLEEKFTQELFNTHFKLQVNIYKLMLKAHLGIEAKYGCNLYLDKQDGYKETPLVYETAQIEETEKFLTDTLAIFKNGKCVSGNCDYYKN
jgi:thiol:disulfide interchange protein DsbA